VPLNNYALLEVTMRVRLEWDDDEARDILYQCLDQGRVGLAVSEKLGCGTSRVVKVTGVKRLKGSEP